MTCDMWHVTLDKWGEVNLLPRFQIPSSNGFGMKICWRFGGKGWLNQWMNEWGVCTTTTAPVKSGLLITYSIWCILFSFAILLSIYDSFKTQDNIICNTYYDIFLVQTLPWFVFTLDSFITGCFAPTNLPILIGFT